MLGREMNRIAFKMQLYNGCSAEYKKRHDEIWPELSRLLKKAGVRDYSIYLDEETHILFASLRVGNPKDLDKLPALEIMNKWWAYMADVMVTNDDHSPVTKPLTEMFYMP